MSGKSRKLGSTRRNHRPQRDIVDDTNMQILDEEPFSSDILEKVQEFFQECDKENKGFITRKDMQKAKGNFLCSPEELEILFDGLDNDRKGYLTTEEFTTGLRMFVQSQDLSKEERKKRLSSKRKTLSPPMLLSLEEADNEEQRHFKSFMEHLGANNIFEDESEIWKLWAKLRHDEPYLLGNLEEFLAKVTNQIKEARKEKETLELTLKKRISEHNEEVQQLYEEMEQQINKEKERLQTESDARSNFQSKEIKKKLHFKENDIQHLVMVQNELETQLHNLRSKQQVTNTENEKLKRTNRDLEEQLEGIRQQLFEAQDRLQVMRNKANQQPSEEHREQMFSVESRDMNDKQDIPQQPAVIPADGEVTPVLVPEAESLLCHIDLDMVPHVIAQTALDVAEFELSSRPRVISIEEDPLPEYMTAELGPLQSNPQDQSGALAETSSLEMLLNNLLETNASQADDLLPPLNPSIQSQLHSIGTEQAARGKLEENKQEKPTEALECAPEGHADEKEDSGPGTHRVTGHDSLTKEPRPSQREVEVLVHSPAHPVSELLLENDGPGQTITEMAEHDHIADGDAIRWVQREVLDHTEGQPNFEEETQYDRFIKSLSDTYTLVWDIGPHPVCGTTTVQENDQNAPEESTAESPVSCTVQEKDRRAPEEYTAELTVSSTVQEKDRRAPEERTAESPVSSTVQGKDRRTPEECLAESLVSSMVQDILQQELASQRVSEILVPENKGKKRVTFTACVLERLSEAGIQHGDEQSFPFNNMESKLMGGKKPRSALEEMMEKQTSPARKEKMACDKQVKMAGDTPENAACDPTGSEKNLIDRNIPLALDMRHNPDHVFKVLFVGNSSVGKSSFLYRVHDGIFRSDLHATIGMDYRIKTLIIDNECFALQMWDTAGQERYQSITKQFFRKADGIVVMYDVTSTHSFTAVRYWLDCIQEVAGDSVLVLLIGNKIDCKAKRQVSTREGEQLAQKYNLLFYECSAAADVNISQSINHLARSLKEHEERLKNNVVLIPFQSGKRQRCCT